MFQPTTIESSSVKAIHLENRRRNDKDDHSKKPPFKPSNGKFKGKGKGKERRQHQRRKIKEKRLITLTTKMKVMMTIIVGSCTQKRSQRNMVERVRKRR